MAETESRYTRDLPTEAYRAEILDFGLDVLPADEEAGKKNCCPPFTEFMLREILVSDYFLPGVMPSNSPNILKHKHS